MVLDGLPGTVTLQKLEAKRKHGLHDYRVTSYFTAYVVKLATDQQLIRQLNLNSHTHSKSKIEGIKGSFT